jgi:hypothetical protein
MKTIKHIKTSKDHLNEIYQQIDLKFALVNIDEELQEVKPLTAIVKCRDYLSDALVTAITGTVLNRQYGFLYKPEDSEVWDISRQTNLLLQVPDKYVEIFNNNFHLINDLEEWYGWDISTIEKVSGGIAGNETYLLVGDRQWSRSTFMISLYTFLLRIMCEKNESISPDIETHVTYVATLGAGSKNNAAICQSIVKSGVPIWGVIQHIDEIHANTNIIGESSLEISPSLTPRIHDYGGILRFFDHVTSFRTGADKSLGMNKMHLLHDFAWNYFQLDTSNGDVSTCTT